MSAPLSREETLDRFFLEMRSRTLDLAAALDRVHAAAPHGASGSDDPRISQVRAALRAVLEDGCNRAENVQMIFSEAYDPAWRLKFRAS